MSNTVLIKCRYAGRTEKVELTFAGVGGAWLSCVINASCAGGVVECPTFVLGEQLHRFELGLDRISSGSDKIVALQSFDCQSGLVFIPASFGGEMVFVDAHFYHPAPLSKREVGSREPDGQETEYRERRAAVLDAYPFYQVETASTDDLFSSKFPKRALDLAVGRVKGPIFEPINLGLRSSICGMQVSRIQLAEVLREVRVVLETTKVLTEGL